MTILTNLAGFEFRPGDFYMYQNVGGDTTIFIRSNEGNWFRMIDGAGSVPCLDVHIRNSFEGNPDAFLVRRGEVYYVNKYGNLEGSGPADWRRS